MKKQKFPSKVRGVSEKNLDGSDRQKHIRKHCKRGRRLILKREPDNPADPNAISIWIKAKRFVSSRAVQIGYLSREIARDLAPIIDGGGKVEAKITEVTGGTKEKPTRGVNIELITQG